MVTLKVILKHAGTSLVSNLIACADLGTALTKALLLKEMWRSDHMWKDSGWFRNDEGMHQRDFITIPEHDEAPLLLRMTIDECKE